MEQEKEICDCGANADWVYMPSSTGNKNPFYCDSCVPRGCSCNERPVWLDSYGDSGELAHMIEHKIKFRIADNMLNGEEAPYLSHKRIVELDEQGRERPCVEFMHLRVDSKLIDRILG